MDHDHGQMSGEEKACCGVKKEKFDWLLWGSVSVVGLAFVIRFFFSELGDLSFFAESAVEIMNDMWWGLLIGVALVGFLSQIPKKFVMSVLGKGGTFNGILRAVAAGVLLDLCSHGILVIGMQLYRRGASLGQLMAFLIASPWNSISLTFILWAMVGWKWLLLLLGFSLVIALVSGLIFDGFVKKGILPENPNKFDLPEGFHFWQEAVAELKIFKFTKDFWGSVGKSAWNDSKMILRWIFLGVVLAALIRTFIDPDQFASYFGPTLAGLGLTVVIATIMEVCSEGSVPIAADLLTRAGAPGNSFAFLMTGVATDYTEIMSLKETTKSWKISLFLPLVTVPQVLLIAWMMNYFA